MFKCCVFPTLTGYEKDLTAEVYVAIPVMTVALQQRRATQGGDFRRKNLL